MMKKRILLVADVKGLAFHRKCLAIQNHLKNWYNIDVVTFCENSLSVLPEAFKEISIEEYDGVVFFMWLYYSQWEKLKKPHGYAKIFIGISSVFETMLDSFSISNLHKEATAVFVNNLSLYEKFKAVHGNYLYLCENGVEENDFFETHPIDPYKKILTIGFVGNQNSPGMKGLYDIIIPTSKLLEGVEVKYISQYDKEKFCTSEMRDFYNNIDCYVCASKQEGTPNPCYEAAACGRPIITTRVGCMPELIRDGGNGQFIERSIEDLKDKLEYYRNNRDIMIEHGKEIKRDILSKWTWSYKAIEYKKMFDVHI